VLGGLDYPPEVAIRVCQTWVRDRRLLGLPRKNSHKIPLLDVIAQDFEPGVTYSAEDVQSVLQEWHHDTATLRRYLVDEGFLDRFADGSQWWRCGGTVDLDVDGLLAEAAQRWARSRRRRRSHPATYTER
jgi:hypothetical protein